MPNQQYCLRWTNHQPNFISVFSSLLSNECLVDVTLAAEGKYLQAHKVVLSACSLYFQELFSINPSQHPIVILKDILFKDLKTVVEFIYNGEVNISQEQLQSVLKAAETLSIKGLADMPLNTVSQQVVLDKRVVDSQTVHKRKKLKKLSSYSYSGSTPNSSVEEVEILGPNHLTIKSEEGIRMTNITSDYSKENNFKYESSSNSNDNSITQNNSENQISPPMIKCEPPENVGSISVITRGKKRGRMLTRQPHIAKFDGDDEISDSEISLSSKRPFCRQYSDPTPQQNTPSDSTALIENKSNLLSVPCHHLTKQNSDSVLPTQMSSQNPFDDEYRHLISQQNTQPRSNHCPELRPGPALGCNYCWNTIDDHGRILRRKTKYHCPECRTNLCIVPCFQDYHDKRKDSDGENECIKEQQKDSEQYRIYTIQKHQTSTST